MDITEVKSKVVKQKIDGWIARLLDFSARNKLLYFKATGTTVKVIHPEMDDLFRSIVESGRSLTFILDKTDTLPGLFDANGTASKGNNYRTNEVGTESTPQQLTRSLYNLHTRSRSAREEQGINILFLAFGMLHWQIAPQAEFINTPLVLVPVDLVREAPGKPYKLSMRDDDIVVNPTLQEALRQFSAINLPDVENDISLVGLTAYYANLDMLISNQSGWKLEKRTILDVFSYHKQMIVKDLQQNREVLIKNPFTISMSITGYPFPNIDTPFLANELDDKVTPQDTFQVLDADSSQQEAIQAAIAGQSFVLQGPPGTGKSQTIANIIAEFLARGKKVLFVSAKMAALEVVQDRLNRVGLGDFCLPIHSHKRNKGEVLKELGYSLDRSGEYVPPSTDVKLLSLWKTRSILNSFIRSLHRPQFKSQISLFDCISKLALIGDAPNLRFILPRIKEITQEEISDIEALIKMMATFDDIIVEYYQHPWYGCCLEDYSSEKEEEIREILGNSNDLFNQLKQLSTSLSTAYGVMLPETLEQVSDLMKLAITYKPIVLNLALNELKDSYTNKYSSILRLLKKRYWHDASLLAQASFSGKKPNIHRIRDELDNAIRVSTRRLPEIDNLSLKLDECPDYLPKMQTVMSLLIKCYSDLGGLFFNDKKPKLLVNTLQNTYSDINAWAQNKLRNLPLLRRMVNFLKRYRESEQRGVVSFVDEALVQQIEPVKWLLAFQRQLYTLIANLIKDSENILSTNNTTILNQWISEFRQLDEEQLVLARNRIREKVLKERPASWVTVSSSQVSILRKELNKKRRIKPLRRLFSEIPTLLLRLRPCLMMSPLTVSQLLNGQNHLFDLVIFDEASQILPEEAVGAILRGKQAIVAGDRHQLPPTSFFDIVDKDEFDTEDNLDTSELEKPGENLESILDELDAMLPPHPLLWHYRSRDESLIAFSNKLIYDNKLQTFPAPTLDKTNAGVEFLYIINGIYQRNSRRNVVEAEKVVDLVIQHYQEEPSLSLGVVTFSQSQRETIQLLLDQRLRELPELQKFFNDTEVEPFFVKNLELVQGDERDLMYFSVGYGKDEVGRFILNFGPLNRVGGERRLNVAITRARRKVVLISSIMPEDINLTRTQSRGVYLLQKYMEYARDGISALYGDIDLTNEGKLESTFESAVCEALTARGLQLHSQVGISHYRIDLAVIDPERPEKYLLGIECDGAQYHSTPIARERDRLRQQVLENLGWRIHRIWSLDWNENSEREIEKVLHVVQECKQCRGSSIKLKKEVITEQIISKPITRQFQTEKPQPSIPRDIIPYEVAILPHRAGGLSAFYSASGNELSSYVQKIVTTEGPILVEDVVTKIREIWDVSRGRKVEATIKSVIGRDVSKGLLTSKDGFLWPTNMKEPRIRKLTEKGIKRNIEQISIDELIKAIILCLKDALSMTKSDLVKQIAHLYSMSVTEKVTTRISSAVSKMIVEHIIIEKDDAIQLYDR